MWAFYRNDNSGDSSVKKILKLKTTDGETCYDRIIKSKYDRHNIIGKSAIETYNTERGNFCGICIPSIF